LAIHIAHHERSETPAGGSQTNERATYTEAPTELIIKDDNLSVPLSIYEA
jgi:hypothetical protein